MNSSVAAGLRAVLSARRHKHDDAVPASMSDKQGCCMFQVSGVCGIEQGLDPGRRQLSCGVWLLCLSCGSMMVVRLCVAAVLDVLLFA